jgi:hypothetical protein
MVAMRAAVLALWVPLVLAAGCSPEGESTDNVAEEPVTEFTDPAVEEGTEQPIDPGDGPVAVELPGLPIGGEGAVFSEPSTQCLSVNLTGEPFPRGVQVVITGFSTSPQFAVSGGSCGLGLPVCLEGAALSWSTEACETAVTWSGVPLEDGEFGLLAVRSAVAQCAEAALCEEAFAIVSRAEPEVIELFVEPS